MRNTQGFKPTIARFISGSYGTKWRHALRAVLLDSKRNTKKGKNYGLR